MPQLRKRKPAEKSLMDNARGTNRSPEDNVAELELNTAKASTKVKRKRSIVNNTNEKNESRCSMPHLIVKIQRLDEEFLATNGIGSNRSTNCPNNAKRELNSVTGSTIVKRKRADVNNDTHKKNDPKSSIPHRIARTRKVNEKSVATIDIGANRSPNCLNIEKQELIHVTAPTKVKRKRSTTKNNPFKNKDSKKKDQIQIEQYSEPKKYDLTSSKVEKENKEFREQTNSPDSGILSEDSDDAKEEIESKFTKIASEIKEGTNIKNNPLNKNDSKKENHRQIEQNSEPKKSNVTSRKGEKENTESHEQTISPDSGILLEDSESAKEEIESEFRKISSDVKEDHELINDCDSSSESEWEEVEERCDVSLDDYKPNIPAEGVEITIDCPDLTFRKRRKKKDENERIRLCINRIRKGIQLRMHKTHLLCLLAHGLYVNQILNSDSLKALALSLIPPDLVSGAFKKKIDKLDEPGIVKIITWFRSVFSYEAKKSVFSNVYVSLVASFLSQKSMNYSEYNLMFIVLARTLGLKVRCCLCLYPVPYKASNLIKKPNSKRQSSKARNPNESMEDDCLFKGKNCNETAAEPKNEEKKAKLENSEFDQPCKSNLKPKHSESKMYKMSIVKTDTDDEGFAMNENSSNESKKTLKQKPNIRPRHSKSVKYKMSSDENDTDDEDYAEETSCHKGKKTSNQKLNKKTRHSKSKKLKMSSDENDTDDEDYVEETPCHKSKKISNQKLNKRTRHSKSKKYKMSSEESDTDDEDYVVEEEHSNGSDTDDEDFVRKEIFNNKNNKSPKQFRKNSELKRKSNCKILSSKSDINSLVNSSEPDSNSIVCWAEIFCKPKKQWIPVECVNNIINRPHIIESLVPQPVSYIIAIDNASCIKDVTRRYCNEYMTSTLKLRADPDWWEETLQPFLPPNSKLNEEEEKKLDEMLVNKPLPTTLQGFKNHPLYVLKRHLLKFEAIYPPDAPPVGFFRSEPVYARDCVHLLHSRERWMKDARVVRVGEEPYKIVKQPRWDKIARVIITGVPLEIFGKWQTEPYEPPAAVDGKVPRNEYGNVELFKPCMLPKGTVYLQLPGLNRIAKKLNIDCSPALVGFEPNRGFIRPMFDGFVVCEEFKDEITAAWNEEQENIRRRQEEKREKRIYGNWKKLIKGLLIKERIKLKYDTK